jgi:uncharacterized damage-inducible protein DinB
MFRRIDDFDAVWRNEREGTLKTLRALNDASLGLKVEAPEEKAPQPATAAAIADAYHAASESLATTVKQTWSDSDLLVEIDMYGERWTRGKALWALVAHEIHHRAQMTVLMRQANLRVPGIYGPSKEEWVSYGMPAQE